LQALEFKSIFQAEAGVAQGLLPYPCAALGQACTKRAQLRDLLPTSVQGSGANFCSESPALVRWGHRFAVSTLNLSHPARLPFPGELWRFPPGIFGPAGVALRNGRKFAGETYEKTGWRY
jgi:hypothetical protein